MYSRHPHTTRKPRPFRRSSSSKKPNLSASYINVLHVYTLYMYIQIDNNFLQHFFLFSHNIDLLIFNLNV